MFGIYCVEVDVFIDVMGFYLFGWEGKVDCVGNVYNDVVGIGEVMDGEIWFDVEINYNVCVCFVVGNVSCFGIEFGGGCW